MTPFFPPGKIGDLSKAGKLNWFERGLAHGAVQGAREEATGGEFRHGFYSGFAIGAAEGEIASTFANSEGMQYTAAAVVGGTASVLGGGKFANGAVSGAFSYLFNASGGVLKGLTKLRLGLKAFGQIPLIGEVADLASAGISVAQGDYVGAGLDLVSAIPGPWGNAAGVAQAGRLLNKAANSVQSFKSFSALKRALEPAGPGKAWHHIVEQSQVGRFGAEAIHNTDNVLAISADANQALNALYSSKNFDLTGSTTMTVRQWLSTKSYDDARAFGLKALDLVK